MYPLRWHVVRGTHWNTKGGRRRRIERREGGHKEIDVEKERRTKGDLALTFCIAKSLLSPQRRVRNGGVDLKVGHGTTQKAPLKCFNFCSFKIKLNKMTYNIVRHNHTYSNHKCNCTSTTKLHTHVQKNHPRTDKIYINQFWLAEFSNDLKQ